MILVVGLGNPGKKYEKTRHNVGFMVIDELKKKELTNNIKLLKPETFMNSSGIAVSNLMNFYKIKPENLWVIHDDIDILIGKIRISKNRGAGGHKGIQSIIKEIGTKDFQRIRIGICPLKDKPEYLEKFVLQKFFKSEEKILNEVIEKVTKSITLNSLLTSEVNRS